jgi:hypothetical protein
MIKSPCTSSGQQLGAGIMSSLDTPQHVTSLDQEIIKPAARLLPSGGKLKLCAAVMVYKSRMIVA